jgi:tRNA (adenine22-N1)-methyltransferase
MDISNRLLCISKMVDRCQAVVDVGTDHGYIPIYLIKNNICKKAVAGDINIGPVRKAEVNVEINGLYDKINCRLGNGLNVVKPGEVQCAVIAGMGGNLIRDIVESSLSTFKALDFAVLQPVQNPEILRKHIYEAGYSIIDEELCFDENKYYEIIKVRFGEEPKTLDEIYYEISPILIKKKHPLLSKYIEVKIEKNIKIIESIKVDSEFAVNRKRELVHKVEKLKEILSWL